MCNCIDKINEELRAKDMNLRLCGYALMLPDLRAVFTASTEWIDAAKIPKGKKKAQPKIWASHCPFCGEAYPVPTYEAAEVKNTVDDTTKPGTMPP